MSTTAQDVETREFQAETKKLLDLVIHSLYTNKEIFLRELISNASDALDRLRFEALTNPELTADGDELEIRLKTDAAKRTLTVSDNGIGMSRQEVIDNIGSIAKSGTRELVEKLKEAKDSGAPPELIGNFGVGFYSSFMVADKVIVETRKAGEEESTRWESRADGSYTIGQGGLGGRGTVITLELKPPDPDAGLDDYTTEWTLGSIVKRHSDFIQYPVRLKVTREEKEKDAKGIAKPDGTTTIVTEDKTLNSQTPIWARAESEVKDEEYNEFYQHLTGDWEEPLLRLALKAEGVSEYQSLLYIPARSPQDLYYYNAEYGLRLYAKRVMIMERSEELLPRWLRFVQGVVDAADLPLNVSRQMLQESRHVAQIRKWLTRKVVDALAGLQKDDPEKYANFWEHFGKAVKEGVTTEFQLKDRLIKLLQFHSSADAEKQTTLSDYVGRMREGQQEIYYLTGESRAICANSPLLEAFETKGYEVLFLTDAVDELVLQYLPEFEGKKLKSIAKGEVNLGSEEEKKKAEEDLKQTSERHKGLVEFLQNKLETQVKKVRLSSRLTESPACLAADEHDMSPQMERLMRLSQGDDAPRQKRILELNPSHEIVKKMQERYAADAADPLLPDYAELLYGYAALAEGSELPDPVRFNKLLAALMTRGA